jgi:hypothetical protein
MYLAVSFGAGFFFLDTVSRMPRCFWSRVCVVYTEYQFNIFGRSAVSFVWDITQDGF